MSASAEEAATASPQHFQDLPEETQREIVGHCSQSDLICLALVSRKCRELAAAQLYRSFHIVFPDEDDPAFDSPIDGLAGGLDTFVTSDYDYAKHLRDLSLDTLSAGEKAESAYKPYLYNVSCGKFMNTLLLLTLRKAKSLEIFRWNIRVELSRPVYKALHQIGSLRVLHVRLQSGPSIYETPPPLPFDPIPTTVTIPPSNAYLQDAVPSSWAPAPGTTMSIAPASALFYIPVTGMSLPTLTLPTKPAKYKPKKAPNRNEPPTLSGFKNLKELAILDIDSLDGVLEIKSCVQKSARTLTKLKLSFSDSLGSQARKPQPPADPHDSDPEDEFQVAAVPPPGSSYQDDAGDAVKAFRAQEEKRRQESVLERILDVETYQIKKAPQKPRTKDETGKGRKDEAVCDPAQKFINSLKGVTAKLMRNLNGQVTSLEQQEVLDLIERAARRYVQEQEAKKAKSATDKSNGEPSASSSETTGTETKNKEAAAGDWTMPGFAKPDSLHEDVNPEDINIEDPEEQFVSEPNEPSERADNEPTHGEALLESYPSKSAVQPSSASPKLDKAMANLDLQRANFKALDGKLEGFEAQSDGLSQDIMQLHHGPTSLTSARETKEKMAAFDNQMRSIQNEMFLVERKIADAEKQLPKTKQSDEIEAWQKQRAEYVRETRGIALEKFYIYLIPVKPMVLKAIDLHVLKHVTMLNVGPQSGIWKAMAEANKEAPLKLTKIFTDNVSVAFLTFVSQLLRLEELFILERDAKYKPESFAPPTTITVEQIRRLALKKHLPTLKRLSIRNNADTTWDVDVRTMALICRRGGNLQELAFSMGVKATHVLLQNMPGLRNLRALHVIQLRNDDTCLWVLRETKRFLVDNVSHHPSMKLEWIAIDEDDRVERLVRKTTPTGKKGKRKQSKAKGKQKAMAVSVLGTDMSSSPYPMFPSPDTLDDLSSESSDENDTSDLKIELMEGIHFYDVWGVRIFKKETVTGRL